MALTVEMGAEPGRYGRQELITWWDQDRLRNACVLVVGAGALGNELVKNLVLLGVGRIDVVDLDDVEMSNLSRCVLFRESDEGMPKAEVVAQRARELNGDVVITPFVGDVRLTHGLGAYREFDVVLGGLDNREARLHVNSCCLKAGVPWVDGAIEGLLGVARTFLPDDGACYECTMNDRDRELLAMRRSCSLLTREEIESGRTPTTATSGSVIAGIQVQEAIKLLHRDVLPYTFGGHGYAFNGMTHDSYVVAYQRDPNCLAHDSYDFAELAEVSPETIVKDLLDRGRRELDAADGVLAFEHDLVVSLDCATCSDAELSPQPVANLRASDVRCPSCTAERLPRTTTVVDEISAPELLDVAISDLNLPAFDAITARSTTARRHYIVQAMA